MSWLNWQNWRPKLGCTLMSDRLMSFYFGRPLWDLERIRKGCVISIYKLQNVSPYCLIKQVNKILGIRNSEIWLFDDVSKIYTLNTKKLSFFRCKEHKCWRHHHSKFGFSFTATPRKVWSWKSSWHKLG